MASARWRIVLDQPSPAARPGCCVRGSCGARPLRQSYIKPHCPQCQPVSRKLLLWQPPLRALSGEGNRLYAKLPSLGTVAQPSALPGRWHALRVAVCAPLWLSVALWHWSGAARCVAGQWPAASHVVCAPAHPCASPLRGISPARWSARPPPEGAPSARAHLPLSFAIGLVAAHARNTGATGLTACMPAWPLAYYFTLTSQAAMVSALSCTLGVQCPRSSCTTMRCLTMRSTVLMRSITRQMGSLPWA